MSGYLQGGDYLIQIPISHSLFMQLFIWWWYASSPGKPKTFFFPYPQFPDISESRSPQNWQIELLSWSVQPCVGQKDCAHLGRIGIPLSGPAPHFKWKIHGYWLDCAPVLSPPKQNTNPIIAVRLIKDCFCGAHHPLPSHLFPCIGLLKLGDGVLNFNPLKASLDESGKPHWQMGGSM